MAEIVGKGACHLAGLLETYSAPLLGLLSKVNPRLVRQLRDKVERALSRCR